MDTLVISRALKMSHGQVSDIDRIPLLKLVVYRVLELSHGGVGDVDWIRWTKVLVNRAPKLSSDRLKLEIRSSSGWKKLSLFKAILI